MSFPPSVMIKFTTVFSSGDQWHHLFCAGLPLASFRLARQALCSFLPHFQDNPPGSLGLKAKELGKVPCPPPARGACEPKCGLSRSDVTSSLDHTQMLFIKEEFSNLRSV